MQSQADAQTQAQALLEAISNVTKQEKAAHKLYLSAHLAEEKEAYEVLWKRLEAEWNQLYEQIEALGLEWGFVEDRYVLK